MKDKYETVIGLGLTSQNPNIRSPQLMEAVLHQDKKGRIYDIRTAVVYPKLQLCYSNLGKAAACVGNTGGPLVYKLDNGYLLCLLGFSSFNAERYDDPVYPSVFTSASYFNDWIWHRMHLLIQESAASRKAKYKNFTSMPRHMRSNEFQ